MENKEKSKMITGQSSGSKLVSDISSMMTTFCFDVLLFKIVFKFQEGTNK